MALYNWLKTLLANEDGQDFDRVCPDHDDRARRGPGSAWHEPLRIGVFDNISHPTGRLKQQAWWPNHSASHLGAIAAKQQDVPSPPGGEVSFGSCVASE